MISDVHEKDANGGQVPLREPQLMVTPTKKNRALHLASENA